LLIVALIIIPPAAARPFARTPEAMAILAALIGAVSAPLGLFSAFAYDLPAGPSHRAGGHRDLRFSPTPPLSDPRRTA